MLFPWLETDFAYLLPGVFFIKKSERRHAGLVGARKAMKHSWNLKLGELNKITEMWADTALELGEKELKIMNRLVAAQGRLAARIAAA